jgi:hypothetical protein
MDGGPVTERPNARKRKNRGYRGGKKEAAEIKGKS